MNLKREILLCVEAARSKKAEDILVLDLRGLCNFTDTFVICHGTSTRQVLSISEAVEETLAASLRLSPGHVEGRRVGDWVLLDYIDFVVHVFLREKRTFYGLERLWGDAPRIEVPESESADARDPARPARRNPSGAR
jgi:ribosome-associated protein